MKAADALQKLEAKSKRSATPGAKVVEALKNPIVNPRFTRKLPVEDVRKGVDSAAAVRGTASTEAELCQQLLVDGFVQSYVDFYHLTHRADPNAVEGRVVSKIKMNVDDLIFIKDNLVQAEKSRRNGNTNGVYTAYNKLADMYMKNMDWKTSIFFHEKCLEVAQLTADMRAEMSANHALGKYIICINDY